MNSYKRHFLFLWIPLIMMPQTMRGQSIMNELDQYDDSLSMMQRIEGIWISDIYTRENFSGLPSCILVVHDGLPRLEMIGYGYAETLASNSPSNIPMEERSIAQRIEDYNSSLYIAWSNERLRNPNQTIASELGQAGGDVAHEITKRGMTELIGNSFWGDLGSDLVSGIIADVVSGLIIDAFTPSKKIVTLEMTIQQDNEYELTGNAIIQEIKIKGEQNPIVTKNEQEIHFTRYDPASGVFFDIPFEQKIYIPGNGLAKEIKKEYKEIGRSFIKYYDLRVPMHISQETLYSNYQTLPSNYSDANPFNIFQIKKLQYYNEIKILNHGYEHTFSEPDLGASMIIKEDKKGMKRCYVNHVSHSSPAYLFDIQEGDYIISIDGFNIETPEQAEQYINSLKPFEWVTICLKRGRKILNVDVELSKL